MVRTRFFAMVGLAALLVLVMVLVFATPAKSQSVYTNSFQDDYARSSLCVNVVTGDWSYTVLKGNGAGNTYTGRGVVQAGSGYIRITAAPGQGDALALIYYTNADRATATFTDRADAVSSALYDSDTANDSPTCGQ